MAKLRFGSISGDEDDSGGGGGGSCRFIVWQNLKIHKNNNAER